MLNWLTQRKLKAERKMLDQQQEGKRIRADKLNTLLLYANQIIEADRSAGQQNVFFLIKLLTDRISVVDPPPGFIRGEGQHKIADITKLFDPAGVPGCRP